MKNINKIIKHNRKSIMVTYEDNTFEIMTNALLLDIFFKLPSNDRNFYKIVQFFEDREENNIGPALYRYYTDIFKAKMAIEGK